MSSTTPPSAETITTTQFNHILSLYPFTVEKAYQQNGRLKDSKKNPKKLSDALDDDTWRYDHLPGVLAARKAGRGADRDGEGPWLEKEELERLVGWKM